MRRSRNLLRERWATGYASIVKIEALEAIGETGLDSLTRIDRALAANDRLKYYLSLLQTALEHADHPEEAAVTLQGERLQAGIDDAWLDDVVARARKEAGRYRIPRAGQLLKRLGDDLSVMAGPIVASETHGDGFDQRLERALASIPAGENDLIDAEAIAALTGVGSGESLHQLVMEMHKELNAMQAELAPEVLDGASVYHLDPADRPLVAAFMAGVNRTARLKFGHPGLGTTATRTGGRLVIQNDIGETKAHVVVVHVDGLAIALTYADVHAERLAFFQQMLSRFAISWASRPASDNAAQVSGEPFMLATGTFHAVDEHECGAYLEWLGSRLVFLIDWNRARKSLRGFLDDKHRFEVLSWAAREEIGHRGFLELGGAQIINRAIEETGGSAIHFGARLCDVIGADETTAFFEFVFRAATTGLLEKQSQSLIRDRIVAELRGHFGNERRRLLQLASDHACLIFELAVQLRDSEIDAGRASALEHDADQLVIETRESVRRRPEYAVMRRLLEVADDAADGVEEAAFLSGLLERSVHVAEQLRSLTEIVVEASQEWVKATAGAAAPDLDDEDVLLAIDRVGELEHRGDDALRALTRSAIERIRDFREFHVTMAIGGALESATDALKSASLILRESVLADDGRR